jgi:hypothetical protein
VADTLILCCFVLARRRACITAAAKREPLGLVIAATWAEGREWWPNFRASAYQVRRNNDAEFWHFLAVQAARAVGVGSCFRRRHDEDDGAEIFSSLAMHQKEQREISAAGMLGSAVRRCWARGRDPIQSACPLAMIFLAGEANGQVRRRRRRRRQMRWGV